MASTAPTSVTASTSFDFLQPAGKSFLTASPLTRKAGQTKVTSVYGPSQGAGYVCDQLYAGSATIAASGSLSLTFSGSSLNGLDGAALSFARLRAIHIALDPVANLSSGVRVDNTVTHCVAPYLAHEALKGGLPIQADNPSTNGWPVVGSTTDVLKIVNEDSVNTATVQIYATGAST